MAARNRKPAPTPTKFVFDEYKGTRIITFRSDADDRYPFSFGPGKAGKLIDAIEEVGADKIIDALYDLAGRNRPTA
jgi:hypothetical protein